MIRIDIEKQLPGDQLLHVREEIPEGSIVKIYGPSGAGKTTLLKIIAGLVGADQGFIQIDNTIWLDTSKKNRAIAAKTSARLCVPKLCAVPQHDGAAASAIRY